MLYPVPAVLVSVADSAGNDNLITIAWTGTVCSDPAMTYISVRKERYSHHMLKENKEFVINLVSKEICRAADFCGVRSGCDLDKFEATGLTREKASTVNVPLVKESPVNIECKVTQVLELGGSGAGKTTFFNAVMGYEKARGKIVHDGRDIYKEYAQMKYEIGFVPQQDLLRDDDTVYHTLDNAAQMKMPADTANDARQARIDQVLEMLGLQRERDSLVKKLSGGQKKRLNIAVEFIADPSLFFLDEPDSGLDGIMAAGLMQNLRVIADEGKIVMVITHAPDRVAHLFDKVIVLAKSAKTNSGHLAFYGSIDAAKEFFDADSLEGIVKRINRPDENGDGLSDFYIEKYEKYIGESI